MKKNRLSKYILLLIDLFLCFISLPLSILFLYWITNDIQRYLPSEQIYQRLMIHFILTFLCVLWFWFRLRHYTYRKPFWFELKEIIRTLCIIAIFELAIIAFSKLYFSRYIWVVTWSFALLLVPLGRVLSKKLLIGLGLYIKSTVIIGGGRNALDTYYALVNEPYLGLKVKCFIANNPSEYIARLGIPIIRDNHKGLWESETEKSDQFIIALEDDESSERNYWIRVLSKKLYRFVSIVPSLRGLPLYSTDMAFIFSYDVMLLRINNNLAKRSSKFIKRSLDIIFSLFLIIILSPVLIYIYYKIHKDGGNVIYKHYRIGQNNRLFKCFKFRSMIVNADQYLSELLKSDQKIKIEWEKNFKLKDDPRVTNIGKFLRRTSLDELPQLFNVLMGQMSLVGPRPIIPEEFVRYQDDLDYYFMVKPGMTGLWQISGRSDIDYDARVYFDSWYVKNWSLWNDIIILCKTIKVVWTRKGAY